MRLKSMRAVLLFGALSAFLGTSLSTQAQLAVGTASGGKLVNELDNPQGTVKGAGPTQIDLDTEGGNPSARAKTTFGINKALADTTQQFVAESIGELNLSAYAASYWGDLLTFGGGTGRFDVAFGWTIDGTIWDQNGGFSLLVGPDDFSFSYSEEGTAGSAWVRWRTYYWDNLDLTALALEGANPANPDDALVVDMFEGAFLSVSNVLETSIVIGIGFDWEYGVPLPIGALLEVYAENGAYADFYNSGVLSFIELPMGTTVQSESGTRYNIRYRPTGDPNNEVPEPSAMAMAAMFALVAGGIALRRRK